MDTELETMTEIDYDAANFGADYCKPVMDDIRQEAFKRGYQSGYADAINAIASQATETERSSKTE